MTNFPQSHKTKYPVYNIDYQEIRKFNDKKPTLTQIQTKNTLIFPANAQTAKP